MWGSANGGRLGLGPHVIDTIVVPTLVRDLVNRKVRVWQVSCGTAHSAICTEVTSEFNGGSKMLLGGQVYVCGGATALSRYILSWERIPELDGVGIRQVACGGSHMAAVSSYGELYTWGRNNHGCTGHDASVSITVYLCPYSIILTAVLYSELSWTNLSCSSVCM